METGPVPVRTEDGFSVLAPILATHVGLVRRISSRASLRGGNVSISFLGDTEMEHRRQDRVKIYLNVMNQNRSF